MFKLQFHSTDRGFVRSDFVDLNGQRCSIQESSLATEDAIWIGCDEGLHTGSKCLARMHIDQKMALELIEVLQHFVRNGTLPGVHV